MSRYAVMNKSGSYFATFDTEDAAKADALRFARKWGYAGNPVCVSRLGRMISKPGLMYPDPADPGGELGCYVIRRSKRNSLGEGPPIWKAGRR